MKQRRGVFLLVVAVVFAGVSTAAFLPAYLTRLPDPATADRDGLFRWLVMRDLAKQPLEVRHQLIMRLEQELDEGIEFSTVDEKLDGKQNRRLWKNIELLVEDWFRIKARQYAATSPERQQGLIESEMNRIERWGLADRLVAGGSAASASRPSYERHGRLLEMMRTWVERTDPQKRPAVNQFANAIESYYARRALEGLVDLFTGV